MARKRRQNEMGGQVRNGPPDQARALRLDIQGLRAIAVLSVVLYHAAPRALSGGFVGVDIFFVISGYLIAGILLAEMEQGKFSLLGFYERRVRRLFPALFVMLAVVLAAGAVLLTPAAYEELGRTSVSTIFFASNFDFFSMSDYFDSDAEFRPLLHTWSLAVEEQFYLAFPLLLWLLVSFARRWMRAALVVCAGISFALCLWALERNAAGAFFLAPFRGYELLIGAALAGLPFPARAPQILRDALSLLGLALIGAGLVLINEAVPFPGFAALAPCVGTAMVLFAGANGSSAGGRLISGPSFAFFGALSYSLYLWHWPTLVFGKSMLLGEPDALQTVVLVLVAILLAALSWRFVERPFLKKRMLRLRVFAIGGAGMAAGAAVAGAVFFAHGLPARFDAPAHAMFAQSQSYSPRRWECHNFLHDLRPYERNCVLGAAGAEPHTAIWADSHGVSLSFALSERLAPRGEAVMEITGSGCPPAQGYSRLDQPLCAEQNAITLAGLERDERIDTVIFAVNFAAYPRQQWPAVMDGLTRSVDAMAASGKHIVLVYPIPVFDYDVPTALGMLVQHGQDPASYALNRRRFEAANAFAYAGLEALRQRYDATAVRPVDVLCAAALCPAYTPERGALYYNRDHLSLEGARLVAALFPLDGARSTRHAQSTSRRL
jgi:peptidoglycan/LPS O-acetylase OafA/YrhL